MHPSPSRSTIAAGLALVILTAACQPQAPSFNPDDPAILAAIDSAMTVAMAGSAAGNAEQALSITTRDSTFSFITGDVMLTGYDGILDAFRNTYASIERQDQTILERHVRVIAPDVALLTAVGEGTYTDKAGFTSEPVGLGATIVFVRRNGTWQAVHYHQSIAK